MADDVSLDGYATIIDALLVAQSVGIPSAPPISDLAALFFKRLYFCPVSQ
jgi:hypothetical protein